MQSTAPAASTSEGIGVREGVEVGPTVATSVAGHLGIQGGGGGGGGGASASLARRQVIRLLWELLQEPACRQAVEQDKVLVSVGLLVYIGTLALQRSAHGQTATDAVLLHAGGLWRQEENEAWPEIKACMHDFLKQARLQHVASAMSTHDIWTRLANPDDMADALDALAYFLFAQGLPHALHQVGDILGCVALGVGVGDTLSSLQAECALQRVAREAAAHNAAGAVQGRLADVAQRSSALVGLAALSRAVADTNHHPTLMMLAEFLLPHMLTSASPSFADHMPVPVRRRVVASASALCSSQHVMQHCGPRLVRALLGTCACAACNVGQAAAAAEVVTSPTMSLEHSAMLALALARRKQGTHFQNVCSIAIRCNTLGTELTF